MKKLLSVILMAAMVLSLASINVLADVPAGAEPVGAEAVFTQVFSSLPTWNFIETSSDYKYSNGTYAPNIALSDSSGLSYLTMKRTENYTATQELKLFNGKHGAYTGEVTLSFDMRLSDIPESFNGQFTRIILGDSKRNDGKSPSAWLFNYGEGFTTTGGETDVTFNGINITPNTWYTYTTEINFNTRDFSFVAKPKDGNAVTLMQGKLFGDNIEHFLVFDEMEFTIEQNASFTMDLDNFKVYDYIKSEGKILSPADGGIADGDAPIKLSAYIADATSAWFEVNGTKYNATGSNGVFEATIAANALTAGKKYLDVYSYDSAGNLNVKSGEFECVYPVQANVIEKNMQYTWQGSFTNVSAEFDKKEITSDKSTDGAIKYSMIKKQLYYQSLPTLAVDRYGRVCIEADVKLNTNNDTVGLELGDGTSSNTMDISNGATNPIFCSNGTICNTARTYDTSTWYHLKVAVDLDADKLDIYIDGDLIKSLNFMSDKDKNLTKIHKFNISMNNMEDVENGTEIEEVNRAGLTIDNYKSYEEKSAPKVTTAPTVVANDADSIAVVFDNAFDATPETVTVTCGGTAVTGTPSYNADTKTLTISGLDALTKSSLLNISVDGFTVDSAANTKAIDIPLYVATKGNIYVEPAELIKTDAKNVLVSKCINGGDAAKELKGYILQKGEGIFGVNSTDVAVSAGKTGFITLEAARTASATPYGFIWDANLTPMSAVAD